MRNLLVILILAALAAPLFADEETSARFFIERIEVRNARRVSPDVVIAESRLREGQEYSEDALRDAATRLSRLPFLLSVDFALEKGSERGRHVLVLTIRETKPFFYLLDARHFFSDADEHVEIDYSDRRYEGADGLALFGFRWFVGRRGALHVGFLGTEDDAQVRRDYASLAVGYTQYDLFGTRAFATLNLKRPLGGYGEGQLSPQVVVGIPLSANQTLTLEADETRFERRTQRRGENIEADSKERFFEARWSYNTTNDPFLPTHGTLLHVTPFVGWFDGVSFAFTPEQVTAIPYRERSHGLQAGASRYWEITDRDSIFGDVDGWWAREEIRISDVQAKDKRESRGGGIGAGISHSFWDGGRRASGDSRIELTARYANRLIPEYEVPGYRPGRDVRQVSAAWVRRSSWGLLRLGAGYAW